MHEFGLGHKARLSFRVDLGRGERVVRTNGGRRGSNEQRYEVSRDLNGGAATVWRRNPGGIKASGKSRAVARRD